MAAVTSSKNTMLETLLFMVYLRKLLTQSCDDRCVALDWKYNGSPRAGSNAARSVRSTYFIQFHFVF